MRAAIQTSATAPSVIHRFIAALPGFLRQQGKSGQLCIITTNYDTLMERALTEAGEAFHQLYYVNDGGDGMGCFRERLPDGAIRQVEKPENLRHHRSSAHLWSSSTAGSPTMATWKSRYRSTVPISKDWRHAYLQSSPGSFGRN